MRRRTFIAAIVACTLACPVFQAETIAADRAIPQPLPSHPGNVFLSGESVNVAVPADFKNWKAVDYDRQTVGEGRCEHGQAVLGKLPTGYYELSGDSAGASNRITLAVLEPLRAPTPFDSPIGIDVALAWSYPEAKMAEVVNLCTLAGMNRVRDRLMWAEVESERGKFATNTRYDTSFKIQAAAGLKVLEVNHVSPAWANTNSQRFPTDLRDIYNSYRVLARRWRGLIEAFEPWNEADIKEFGGHTGDEMASLQKAAYLGLKAGNPDLIVCDNVFAIHRQTTLRNFNENQAWPYFDTFNEHHYQPLDEYPKVYEDFRSVSAGRPLWTTECNVTVEWSGDPNLKELSAENARIQCERVSKIYAEALHEGVQTVFYFMLPHYTERMLQYGVLHPDMTPRAAFVAMAAVGRLLAGAKPLGQVAATDKSIRGYLFDAKPDDKKTDVLVIWSEGKCEFELPQPPAACFDLLGRSKQVEGKLLKLTSAPLFVLLAQQSRPAMTPPPEPAPFLPGKPGSVVMQALIPEDEILLQRSAYKMAPNRTNSVPVFLYNFGNAVVRGRLNVVVPQDWTATFDKEVDIQPGERKQLTLKLATEKEWNMAARVRVEGDFGAAGKPLLALRFISSGD